MKKIIFLLSFCFLNQELFAQNTATGLNAGNAGYNNSSYGAYAGNAVTGGSNTFLGWSSGLNTTTGNGNTFLGITSGNNTTIGNNNTFIGRGAGYGNITGSNNVTLGYDADVFATGGSNNVSIGSYARYGGGTTGITAGSYNIALGYYSGQSSTGDENIFVGRNTGQNNTGNYNVFSGSFSGANSGTGAYNTCLGYYAGYNATGSNNVFLGKQAGYGETGSNKLYIENSNNTATPLLYGDFTARQLSINAKPNSTHALTVGGTVHATAFYANGQLITPGTSSQWTTIGSHLHYSAGNVGIGTNAPQSKLQIQGSGGIGVDLKVNGRIQTGDANTSGGMWVDAANTMMMGQYGADRIGLFSNGAWRMIVNPDGNVGIGTASPNAPLQFANTFAKRKVVLYEEGNNDHQYYGLGVETGTTRFQIGNATAAFRFFRADNATGSTEVFTVQGDGKVGVGTAAPAYPLHVSGKIGSGGLMLESNTPGINTNQAAQYLHIYNHLTGANGLKAGGVLVADDYAYAAPAKNDLIVKGKVAIGTPLASNPNNYTLAVNGQVGAKDVRVESSSATWPDYVFDAAYALPSLQEVETFLKVHKHLKEIPSAREIGENGHRLGEMDALLLKKIEELTLYLIEQNKKMEAQQQEINVLRKQVEGK